MSSPVYKPPKLSRPQSTIARHPARFRVVSAGRQFGKSFLSINQICKFSRHPGSTVLYVAPTYGMAKTTIWDKLKEIVINLGWVKRINESELTIRLINGSLIRVRGADNRDALRGATYDFIVLDEFQDIHRDTWEVVLRPTLVTTAGHALFIGTPKGVGTYFHKLWSEAVVEPEWQNFQYTTLEGGFADLVELESARRNNDEKTFRQEYEASFESFTGRVFYNFHLDRHIVTTPDNLVNATTPLIVSCDFNRSPITAGIAVKTATGLHYIDEVHIYGSNTYELVDEIQQRYGKRQYTCYPDATGRNGSTNSSTSDHKILNNNGFRVISGKSNPSIKDSIASVNSLLQNADGDVNLTFDPQCKNIRDSLMNYVYKEGTRQPLKDDIHDHHCDHIRYAVHRMYPLKTISSTPYTMGAVRTL